MIKTVNIDRIIRRSDFSNATSLRVTSMFRTIQGEGPYAGYPSVFLRLAGCNFGDKSPDSACQWCDTFFAFAAGKEYDYKQLLSELLALPGYQSTDVLVVTGGEPTLQHNLQGFLDLALPHFRAIQIETNGTQASFFAELPRGLPVVYQVGPNGVYFVVSPKAIYKAGVTPRPSGKVLDLAGCLKFVVTAEPGPHHEVPEWAFDWAAKTGQPLYVSPMAIYLRAPDGEVASIWDSTLIDKEATAANYSYAAQYAMKHNCLLSLQTHLFTAVP